MTPKSVVLRGLRILGMIHDPWREPRTISEHLCGLLPAMDVDCVFDVGANRGQFAQMIRNKGYKGLILSFEPNLNLIGPLRAASADDERWHVFPYGLGAERGTMTLHVPASDDLASVLPLNEYALTTCAGTDTVHDLKVYIYRLDDIYLDLKRQNGFHRPFLKMDTQGYDLHVLQGAEGVWKLLCGILTEVSFKPLYDGMPDVTHSLDAIRGAGFHIAGLYSVSRDRIGAVMEMDCLAYRCD